MPGKFDFFGVFCISFSTLMYELLLTRLFSVVMWYHFAFVAISSALFGMTLGAIGVYCLRDKIAKRGERTVLSEWSLYFGVLIIPALAVFILAPFAPLLIFAITLPFVASGVVLALALTYFSTSIGRVYAVDLLGAALGCFGVIAALKLTDGPTAVLLAALLGLVAAICFVKNGGKLKKRIFSAGLFLSALIVVSIVSIVFSGQHPFRILHGKYGPEPKAIHEEWNSFSRVNINPVSSAPFGWGLSDKCEHFRKVDQLALKIDGDAGTVLTRYDGNPSNYKYLECDLTNVAYNLLPGSKTFVVGAGGGRDVLSGLVFGAKSITAVELNDEILHAANVEYGDFTGHLDQLSGVSFINDEARSYLTRNPDSYDLIQISLIDTWAATAAGGYTVSENSVYTSEAWQLFLRRLTDRGILSVSRWHTWKDTPFETYRTLSLAQDSLKKIGINSPELHTVLILTKPDNISQLEPISTILVSREPFNEKSIIKLREVVEKYNFDILAGPGIEPVDPVISALVRGNIQEASKLVEGNISPPTDDQPFFFNFIRMKDLVTPANWRHHNLDSLGLLVVMVLTVIILVGLVFSVPFRFGRKHLTNDNASMAIYFLGIGIGFMAIEIGLLQRLSIFFGHPSYSLMVVLPTILATSGLGSMFSDKKIFNLLSLRKRILVLAFILSLTAATVPWFVQKGADWESTTRVLATIAFLFPSGFLMGMPFAMGMRWASKTSDDLKPWLWGLNGGASVAASILAVLLSLQAGISFAFLLGIVGYLATAVAAGRADTINKSTKQSRYTKR